MNIKKIKPSKTVLLLYFILVTFLPGSMCQDYIFTDPVPGSEFIKPQQVIALKAPIDIDRRYFCGSFQVKGSVSGYIPCTISIFSNDRLLTIKPLQPFKNGEKVTVTIPEYSNRLKNQSMPPCEFHFFIEQQTLKGIHPIEQGNSTNYSGLNTEPGNSYATGTDYNRDNNLPADYASPNVIINQNASGGCFFFVNYYRPFTPYNPYLSIWDNYGIPLFYKKMYGVTLNFHKMENGNMLYGTTTGQSTEYNRVYLMDSALKIIDTIAMGNGYNLDMHDFLQLKNGRFLLQAYDDQIVDMSQIVPGGNPQAVVTGLVIQEVDNQRNVYWQWRSWDHFEITDAGTGINLTAPTIDYCHGNAMKIDLDNNLLISCRNMDEITKINRSTGAIIWRMGKYAKKNQFTFTNDPLGYCRQHDIRVLPNGHYTVYDNGNLHVPQVSRALEYRINTSSMEVELVWDYVHDPEVYSAAMGGFQRTSNNSNVICWGSNFPLAITEVDIAKVATLEFYLPDNVQGYRALKDTWKNGVFSSSDEANLISMNGETATDTVLITNYSDHTVSITSIHHHNEQFFFQELFPINVSANGSVEIVLYYSPIETGIVKDVFTFNYDNENNTQRIASQTKVKGIWQDFPPLVTITPADSSVGISPDTVVEFFFNEPVFGYTGDTITPEFIQEIFEFRLHGAFGEEVPFTGSISADMKHIILKSESLLNEDEEYFVKLVSGKIIDLGGNLVTGINKTTFHTSFFTNTKYLNSAWNMEVYPVPFADNLTIVSHYPNQGYVRLYDQKGRLVNQTLFNENTTTLSTHGLLKGVYFVCIIKGEKIAGTKKIIKL